jgi:hypothetical protein
MFSEEAFTTDIQIVCSLFWRIRYRRLLDGHMVRFEACDWTNKLECIILFLFGFLGL